MSKTSNADKRKAAVVDALVALGWKADRYGHLQAVSPSGVKRRVKLQASSVRYEQQVRMVDGKEWVRIDSAYYKDVKVLEDGTVVIGRRALGKLA